MTQDEFGDKLSWIYGERERAKSVFHEQATWDKEFALYIEYGVPDMVIVTKNTLDYRLFEVRYQGQLLYNKTVGTLPKPVRFIVKLLQRLG